MTDYGLRIAAAVALFGAGAMAAHHYEGLYAFAWSHPSVMLVGQFALLAAGTLTRPWVLAGFWLFTGTTAYALFLRAAAELHGALPAALVTAVAVAAALALFARLGGGAPAR
jgi:hypothetical protein